MALKTIRVDDSAPAVSGSEFNRLQTNIQTALTDAAAETPASVVSVRDDYRASASDFVIFVNASRGAVRVTLPLPGKGPIIVRKTDASANAVLLVVAGGQGINGVSRLTAAMPAATLGYDPETKGWFSL